MTDQEINKAGKELEESIDNSEIERLCDEYDKQAVIAWASRTIN